MNEMKRKWMRVWMMMKDYEIIFSGIWHYSQEHASGQRWTLLLDVRISQWDASRRHVIVCNYKRAPKVHKVWEGGYVVYA